MDYYHQAREVVRLEGKEHKTEKLLYQVNCLLNMAVVQEMQHNFNESMKFLKEAVTLDPENGRAVQLYGRMAKIIDAIESGALSLEQYSGIMKEHALFKDHQDTVKN